MDGDRMRVRLWPWIVLALVLVMIFGIPILFPKAPSLSIIVTEAPLLALLIILGATLDDGP